MSDKISVIVPIYNVEEYLKDCLDSIVSQSYTNLEILLVDDGATDKSGAICDEYQRRDSRFRAIHQVNSGLSGARNRGLLEATGEYIGFVDSDDYIERDFFDILISQMKKTNTDIVVCGYQTFGRTEEENTIIEPGVYDTHELIAELLQNDSMPCYVWNKLYKRAVFQGISFPTGRRYEDVWVMHLIFMNAKRISVINDTIYHYRLRRGSITDLTRLNDSKELLESFEKRVADFKGTEFEYPSARGEMVLVRRLTLEMLDERIVDKDYVSLLMETGRRIWKEYFWKFGWREKVQNTLFCLSPMVYRSTLYKTGKRKRIAKKKCRGRWWKGYQKN